MMSGENLNKHHTQISRVHTSPSCFYYYLDTPQSYEVPTSFVISDEKIQSKPAGNKHLRNRNRWNKSSTTMQQSYQTMAIPSDDHKITKIHRSDSEKSEKRRHFPKQQSLEKSSLTFQPDETIDEKQQLNTFSLINNSCYILRNQSTIITNEELTDLLNKLTLVVETFDNNNQQQQYPILIDILNALISVPPSRLTSVSHNHFFPIFQILFIQILRQWRHLQSLPNTEAIMFQSMVKLFSKLIENSNLIPPCLSDSTLLETISNCLTDIATSGKFLDEKNILQFQYFIRLIDAYTLYQQHLNKQNIPNKDTLVQLLDPILHCLTSSRFITTFTNLQIDSTSMTTIQKFFLLKCPAFLTSYNGFRLEQTMDSLLSIMLPQYITLLDKFVPSAHNWKQSMIQSMQYLLKTINHGANQFPTNAKHISYHLSLIDHVLKLVNEPIFYNSLREKLSNPETSLMDTAIRFLVNMMSEPTILAHIKQSHAATVFLRLTSCKYEPLVFNVYTLLAYTTHEDDIKIMHNSDRLLIAIIQSLKTTLNQRPERSTQIEQLLETLKGLVQHDQIKDEIIKQDALPFFLELTTQLTNKALVLLIEILWSLTFFEEIALALRANPDFLQKIQIMSKDNSNEPLKRAVDGLVWKLIQEPTFLKKVTKQEVETDEIIPIEEVTIGTDGEEQVLTTKRRVSMTPSERSYQYDIMVSYCHADKELTYKIHKFLVDQGLKVWIDLDNMYGPAMSAMADAVENSEFVIMCMSDSYKQSTYCQAEAEYAFKCKRRLIPLKMRKGYRPDGWLGLMIGSRMYIDFGRYDFETACEKLMTEISLQRRQTKPVVRVDPLDHEKPIEALFITSNDVEEKGKPSSKHTPEKAPVNKNILSSVFKAGQSKVNFLRQPIDQWTESDVADVLSAHHLNQIIPLCQSMNGRALIQLYKICTTHRLRAYSVLKDELKSVHKTEISINTYSRFLTVIEDAMNSAQTLSQSAVPVSSIDNPPMITTSCPFIPSSDPNAYYDFSITTDMSPLDTLKMVEQFGSQIQLLDSLRHRTRNVF